MTLKLTWVVCDILRPVVAVERRRPPQWLARAKLPTYTGGVFVAAHRHMPLADCTVRNTDHSYDIYTYMLDIGICTLNLM